MSQTMCCLNYKTIKKGLQTHYLDFSPAMFVFLFTAGFFSSHHFYCSNHMFRLFRKSQINDVVQRRYHVFSAFVFCFPKSGHAWKVVHFSHVTSSSSSCLIVLIQRCDMTKLQCFFFKKKAIHTLSTTCSQYNSISSWSKFDT